MILIASESVEAQHAAKALADRLSLPASSSTQMETGRQITSSKSLSPSRLARRRWDVAQWKSMSFICRRPQVQISLSLSLSLISMPAPDVLVKAHSCCSQSTVVHGVELEHSVRMAQLWCQVLLGASRRDCAPYVRLMVSGMEERANSWFS